MPGTVPSAIRVLFYAIIINLLQQPDEANVIIILVLCGGATLLPFLAQAAPRAAEPGNVSDKETFGHTAGKMGHLEG